MDKIDYFGGLHGHYLELVVNVFIWQNGFDINQPMFTDTGACHVKNNCSDYNRIVGAMHFSHHNIPFDSNDRVVRIVPLQKDMLIAVSNSFLRAGDQVFDLDNFEIDTINKLNQMPKAQPFLNQIIKDFGKKSVYPRAQMRNYFYSMFESTEYGLDMYSAFDPTTPNNIHVFPFGAFFDAGQFYLELNKIANFQNLNFYPTVQLSKLHQEFLKVNQGYHSQIKCNQVLEDILAGKNTPIKLNIIEEAWIAHQLVNIFRCYDLPILVQDQFPTNTKELADAVFTWKSSDY
jgi:hypothetical protein